MSFGMINGQEKAKKLLQAELRNHKVSHAYLFTGPLGTGKRQLALSFAKAMFCLDAVDDGCGRCSECRKLEHGNHPYLYQVEPDGQSIKIDQIRELQKRFSFKSDVKKVAIIQNADKMTVQAANSLLKFLEEPIADCTIILLAENGQAILPTIRSRVQAIEVTPLSPMEMEKQLVTRGLAIELIKPAVRLTAGTEAAEELVSQEWFAEIRRLVVQLAQASVQRFSQASILVQSHWNKAAMSEHMDTLLDLFVLWFKDIVQIQAGRNDAVVFVDQTDQLKRFAFQKNTAFWVSCMEHAVEAKKRLRYNVNPQLSLEQFLIHLQGE